MQANHDPAMPRCHPLLGLHRRAIAYARLLTMLHPAEVAARLYSYNSVPLSKTWRDRCDGVGRRRTWPDHGPALARTYSMHSDSHWRQWTDRSANAAPLVHKLYISPRPEALPEVFGEVSKICIDQGVAAFKIGRGSSGILRPDKLVLYFASEKERRAVGRAVVQRLRGAPVQGVPFAPAVDDSGLVSWGVDSVPVGGSWRRYATLQVALAVARGLADAPDFHRAMADCGLDSHSWAPLSWRGK